MNDLVDVAICSTIGLVWGLFLGPAFSTLRTPGPLLLSIAEVFDASLTEVPSVIGRVRRRRVSTSPDSETFFVVVAVLVASVTLYLRFRGWIIFAVFAAAVVISVITVIVMLTASRRIPAVR